jgi:hypothetical protein
LTRHNNKFFLEPFLEATFNQAAIFMRNEKFSAVILEVNRAVLKMAWSCSLSHFTQAYSERFQ